MALMGKPCALMRRKDYFNSQRCPGLKEKPKVFLISACQTNAGYERIFI
jgi:hypothetical protein